MPSVCISVISHGQAALVEKLLTGFEQYVTQSKVELVITINTPEEILFENQRNYRLISNPTVQGFGANHNKAVLSSKSDYIAILNPDIRFHSDPFPTLLALLTDPKAGVVAPLIKDENGNIQDSARKFITPWQIFRRVILKQRRNDYSLNTSLVKPDWVAGMFMLFRREVFEEIGGFDEKYFLYCEDVDICYRLRKKGYEVVLSTEASVIHEAQRASRKKIRYFWLHVKSLLRFFAIYWLKR